MQNGLETIKCYSETHRDYLHMLVTDITRYYGNRLSSLAIFGSYARQENTRYSDLDLFMILNDPSIATVSKRLQEFVALELSLLSYEDPCVASGVEMDISPVIFAEAEATHFNPLYLDMTEHCVMIVDRNHFLQEIIDKVRRKKTVWGSTKHTIASGWYWSIKPDLKWGEVINYDE